MTPVVGLDDLERMTRGVRFLHDETGKFLEAGHEIPAVGSKAAADLAEFRGPVSPMEGYVQGTFLIESAADQMMALLKTITEPVQTFAPWTCYRALLETSAIAAWLLDPDLDGRTRLQRSLALRYEGLVEQAKWVRCAGPGAGQVADVERRIDQVEAQAQDAGFSPVVNKKGQRDGIGQRMPSATEIIGQMTGEETLYRMMSAVNHGHIWAFQLSYRMPDGSVPTPRPGAGEGVEAFYPVKKTLTTLNAAMLLAWSAKGFARPVWYKCLLFGWDSRRLAGVFDAAFDDVGLKPELRYWRSPSHA